MLLQRLLVSLHNPMVGVILLKTQLTYFPKQGEIEPGYPAAASSLQMSMHGAGRFDVLPEEKGETPGNGPVPTTAT